MRVKTDVKWHIYIVFFFNEFNLFQKIKQNAQIQKIKHLLFTTSRHGWKTHVDETYIQTDIYLTCQILFLPNLTEKYSDFPLQMCTHTYTPHTLWEGDENLIYG